MSHIKRTLSDALDGLETGLARPRPAGPGPAIMVGRVATPTSAIAVGQFLTVNPVTVLGAEVEGGPGTLTWDASVSIPVYLAGPVAAIQGDFLVCRFLPFRWVADRNGQAAPPGGIVVAGCPCAGGAFGTTPTTLSMHVTNPDLNGQNFRACTLVYGPTPSAYLPLAIGPNNHYSAESFADTGTGDVFRYLFRCESGYYILRKVYATSIFGSPYLGTVLYKWLIGFPGNNCDKPGQPFQLLQGQIYPGGDTRTAVTVNTSSTS